MVPGKFQPKQDIKKTVSQMARVNRLNLFDDLHLIGKFAERFGKHPDDVYDNTSFGTITNFMVMWKEQSEYDERFQYFWEDANKPPKK